MNVAEIGEGSQKFLFRVGVAPADSPYQLHLIVRADTLQEALDYISSTAILTAVPKQLQSEIHEQEFNHISTIDQSS